MLQLKNLAKLLWKIRLFLKMIFWLKDFLDSNLTWYWKSKEFPESISKCALLWQPAGVHTPGRGQTVSWLQAASLVAYQLMSQCVVYNIFVTFRSFRSFRSCRKLKHLNYLYNLLIIWRHVCGLDLQLQAHCHI